MQNTKAKSSIQDSIAQLETALENINTNESWLEFLSFQSRFYNYSISNQLLIYFQMPTASYVAGFTAWNKMGRTVKRGAKSIKIIAPCRYKVEPTEQTDNEAKYILKGFRLASVFDLSQTEGDDSTLPTLVRGLKDDGDYSDLFNKLVAAIDIPVTYNAEMRAKGRYSVVDRTIELRPDLSSKHLAKCLVHEISHDIHKNKYDDGESRDVAEVIAESSAYIFSAHFNLDTSEYSIPYIGGWCNDIKAFRQVGDKIQKISAEIINLIENSNKTKEEIYNV